MKSTLFIQILLKYRVFVQTLRDISPELTRQELFVAILLRAGLSSSEMAARLHCSVRTVENHRFRIRNKLKLDTSVNLADFMLAVEGENPMLFYWLEKNEIPHSRALLGKNNGVQTKKNE
jgi:DNA-binding CsgD family transcriptional regulator